MPSIHEGSPALGRGWRGETLREKVGENECGGFFIQWAPLWGHTLWSHTCGPQPLHTSAESFCLQIPEAATVLVSTLSRAPVPCSFLSPPFILPVGFEQRLSELPSNEPAVACHLSLLER